MAKRDVKKRRNLITEQRAQLNKMSEKNKCGCAHTKRGELDVLPSKTKREGRLDYVCKQCEKDLNFNKVTEEHLTDACDTVDNVIDTIKISLDLNNEHDEKILEEMAELQYRIRNQVKQLYAKALSKQGTNKKKGNRGGNTDSTWNRPVVNGR